MTEVNVEMVVPDPVPVEGVVKVQMEMPASEAYALLDVLDSVYWAEDEEAVQVFPKLGEALYISLGGPPFPRRLKDEAGRKLWANMSPTREEYRTLLKYSENENA